MTSGRSDGFLVYLGEWHTHPEDFPQPSSTDLRSWRTGLKDDRANGFAYYG
uniref:Mov34/MPN/PAD-1 family protein n=1 Tax=Enterobacter cloacae complex sp. 280C5 TaxID=3395861 RepID=UPI003CED28D9